MKIFPIGHLVIYFDKLQGLYLPEVRNCFEAWDIKKPFEVGILIWVDWESSNGKAYGFRQVEIQSVSKEGCNHTSGMFTYGAIPGKVFYLKDHEKLVSLLFPGDRFLNTSVKFMQNIKNMLEK